MVMSSEIAIKVKNLSKCYQIYDKPNDRLKQFIVPKLCRAIPLLHKESLAKKQVLFENIFSDLRFTIIDFPY